MPSKSKICPKCGITLYYNDWFGWLWECPKCEYIEPNEDTDEDE